MQLKLPMEMWKTSAKFTHITTGTTTDNYYEVIEKL